MVLIISYPILRIKLAPFVETMRFEGAQLSAPKGLSFEKAVIKTIVIKTKVT